MSDRPIWIVFRMGQSPKAPSQRFAENLAFFNARKGLPKRGTTKYADPVLHPTSGAVAFPVNPEDEPLIPNSPHQFERVTEAQLIAEGFWSVRDPVSPPIAELLQAQAAPEPQSNGLWWKVAAGAAAAAATGAALWHYLG